MAIGLAEAYETVMAGGQQRHAGAYRGIENTLHYSTPSRQTVIYETPALDGGPESKKAGHASYYHRDMLGLF